MWSPRYLLRYEYSFCGGAGGEACRCELRGNAQRVFHRAGVSTALADDIEGGAVSRCGEHGFQPCGHGHAFIEPEQLRRDLALIVIHHDDAVILAAQCLEKN